jgi:hypothetical protein
VSIVVELDPIKFGITIQKVEAMEHEVAELRKDVKALLELANKGRGGFWAGMALVSAFSTFIGFVAHYISGK